MKLESNKIWITLFWRLTSRRFGINEKKSAKSIVSPENQTTIDLRFGKTFPKLVGKNVVLQFTIRSSSLGLSFNRGSTVVVTSTVEVPAEMVVKVVTAEIIVPLALGSLVVIGSIVVATVVVVGTISKSLQFPLRVASSGKYSTTNRFTSQTFLWWSDKDSACNVSINLLTC